MSNHIQQKLKIKNSSLYSNWQQFLKIPGNSQCCDCRNSDPRWASINLGITICIECSGVHRSLGVQHSKVRSLTLDAWEPEIIKVMMELGNQVVNNIYEARVDNKIQRASENCNAAVREAWIKAKYIQRRFVLPIGEPTPSSSSSLLLSSDDTTLMDDDDDDDDVNSLSVDANKIGQERNSRKPAVRRWSVRKLRRRPKSKSSAVTPAAAVTKRLSVFEEDTVSSTSNQSGESLLVLGKDIGGDPLPKEDFALSSDQESTAGEDDNTCDDADDIACLNPNLLLYKASAVHNLPVMCQALALGASKDWTNTDDLNRTALHQAVLSVYTEFVLWFNFDLFLIFIGF